MKRMRRCLLCGCACLFLASNMPSTASANRDDLYQSTISGLQDMLTIATSETRAQIQPFIRDIESGIAIPVRAEPRTP